MRDRHERWSRRQFVGGLTLAGTASLLALRPEDVAAEPPPETTRVRFFKAGVIKSNPAKIIAQGTDWRFLEELKRELKG